MSVAVPLQFNSVRDQVSAEEWQVRVDLAAFYRLVEHYGWVDLIYTHISARVPGEDGNFLLNPYGLMFGEITASSLIKVNMDNEIVLENGYEVNQAGFTIHSAIMDGCPDVACAAHTHTPAGMAVSAQPGGLLPHSQSALKFYGRLAYHDYEGIALDHTERERLVRDLGTGNIAMILRNHGLLTIGRTVQESFSNLHDLEKCCLTQVMAQAGGPLSLPAPEVCEHVAKQFVHEEGKASDAGRQWRPWPALLRMLNRENPGYAE
jgi:ribulose-5-phosphate 4-epimerase/fuculose-1-phosphate aldolase